LKDRERKAPVEERPPDHRSFAACLCHSVEVLTRSDAARRQHRQPRASTDSGEQIEVGTGERAVPVDRRAEKPRDTRSDAALGSLLWSQVGSLGPAARGHASVEDINRNDQPAVERRLILSDAVSACERGGPENDARGAGGDQSLGITRGTHATSCLDASGRRGLCKTAHQSWARHAFSRSVEVDDVDQLSTCVDKAPYERLGIRVAEDDSVKPATFESDGNPTQDVDRRKNLEPSARLAY
jgi:hypothetical protein